MSRPDPARSSAPLAFIGGGNMARSLVGGLVRAGEAAARITVAEPHAPLREALARDFGVATGTDNAAAADGAAAIVLAVKPQVMRPVCEELASAVQRDRPLIVSIAAGIRVEQLQHWLGGGVAVVRSMPNTPALIGAGAAGLYADPHCSAAQRALAERILGAAGLCVWIEREDLMDAVTALSGSGPAYFFLLVEALEDAAVEQGLPRETARLLATQTAFGAGRMLREDGAAPATLRERVTSPKGTTQAALDSFAGDGFRAIVARAVAAAVQRGRELSAASGA
ncbi:MAG TPA: pyrroline-5-carboxylate reductase [Rhodanobacteraceae bacterium]|nr:pyrroline-5-carboxylate reductase [Rhodanobacteraceae bacterium]